MPRHHGSAREMGPTQRQLRVGEVLRHALSEILTRGEVRDADLVDVSVTVTQVKPTADMPRQGAAPPKGKKRSQ